MTHSYRQAKDWFEKAAEKGHVDAQYNLGVIYENGEGVSQNYQQAKAWYEKAASQNDAQAQFELGVMNELGQGESIDLKQARHYYERSCNNGLKKGCERLKELLYK